MHVCADLAHELGRHAKSRCLYGNIGRSTSRIALKKSLSIGGEPRLSEIDEHFAKRYELRRENVGHEGPRLMLAGCVQEPKERIPRANNIHFRISKNTPTGTLLK